MEKLDSLSDLKGFHRRRNSYSAAMESKNGIQESTEILQPQSSVVRWNYQRRKLMKTASLESGTFSETSTSSRKTYAEDRTRTPSWEIVKSTSTFEVELPEVFFAYPEITSKLLRSHYLLQKMTSNHQCRCRKESVISNKESVSSFSIRRRDSAFSVSTCQSIIAPSSGRNSMVTLNQSVENRINCNDVIYENSEDYENCPRRRHSDQSNPAKYKPNQRRFSDQTPLGNFHIERTTPLTIFKNKSHSCERREEKPKPIITKAQNLNVKNKKGNRRKDSEVSIASLRRDSMNPITPKMMRRRFSEQLILEGGLGNETEFEELVGDPEAEESLTAMNARKKVTLKRHYYPEGEWGYIVMIVAMCIQIISHGLQTSYGVLLTPALLQYGKTVGETGMQV